MPKYHNLHYGLSYGRFMWYYPGGGWTKFNLVALKVNLI